MNLKILAFFLISFLSILNAKAQKKEYKNTPLKKVLLVLEKQHNIKFSFSDELVANTLISGEFYKNSLDKILKELQIKTGLIFQKITDRYIIISSKNSNKKMTICGYVLNTISKKPLTNATVSTLNNSNGTTTDEDGYFQLNDISTKNQLQVSYIGYKTLLISAKKLTQKPCLKIYLKEFTAVLNEVLITDYLTNGFSKKADGSESISPTKLGILPGLTEPDVLQSIQLLPGVQSPNETASGLHIRGGTPDQNLILFDGIKIYSSAHFFGMISAFNPYITKKVKVFRSGAKAEYGNHISGVIDIETDNEIPTNFSGGFGTNLTHIDGFLKIPLSKNVGFSISARRSFTDFLNTISFEKISEKVFQNSIIFQNKSENNQGFTQNDNNFYFADFNTKLSIKLSSKDKLILNQLFINNELDYRFKFTDNTLNTRDDLQIKNVGFNAKWLRNWSKTLSQNTTLYFSDFDFDYAYNGSQSVEPTYTQSAIKKNEIKDFGLKTILEKRLTKTKKATIGYEFTNNKVRYDLKRSYSDIPEFNYTLGENNQNNTHAFFSDYLYKKEDKLTLQLGLRASYFSLTNKVFLAPRFYGQIKVFPSFWLKASAELKQQNISQIIELSTSDFGLENQVWALASNEIPLLKSNQFTLGFMYRKNNWTIDIDVYRKEINGLTSLTKGFNNSNTNFSEGKSITTGIDVLIKKKWQNYNSWISYSFGNTNFMFSEINNGEKFAGNYDIKHQFLWSHNLKIGDFDFSLGWSLRTGIPYTKATGINSEDNLIYEKTNKSRLPNYHKLDFSATYSFHFNSTKKWKGKVGLSLLNIYNQRNILQRNYTIAVAENNNLTLNQIDTYSLGFTPNLVFRVRF